MYNKNEVTAIVWMTLGLLLLAFGLTFLKAWFGVWLWKIIAVEIFGLPVLSYWQFFGLAILFKILIPTSYNINRKD